MLTLSACHSQSTPSSEAKAQIDAANSLLTSFGLPSMPTYDELLALTSVTLKDPAGAPRLPWVDSYWPTQDKGLARRWGYINAFNEPNRQSTSDFMLGAYFSTQQENLRKPDGMISVNLAPAEKFDIVYRLKKGYDLLVPISNLESLTALDEKQKEFAANDLDTGAILTEKRSLAQDYLQTLTAPSVNAGSYSPMTEESLKKWLTKASDARYQFPGTENSGIDWSWEGICDGWASAALQSAEPKHAVRVEIPQPSGPARSLFFTEGDMRAYLSRVWSSDSGKGRFMVGRRCEANTQNPQLGVPSNAEGRAISGQMKYERSEGGYLTSPFSIVQDYPQSTPGFSLYRIILEREWSDQGPRFAFLIQQGAEGPKASYRVAFDEATALSEIENPTAPKTSRLTKDVEIYGCWDVNPASFHTLIAKSLGERNQGIIMDRTQNGQVWNQPIAKAEFKIEELRPIADLKDIDTLAVYRSPGTAFIAQVSAEIFWAKEPKQPSLTYQVKDKDLDALNFNSSTYTYTLEFDQDKRLIGGEWGDFAKAALPADNPDFVFGFNTAQTEPDLSGAPAFIQEGYDRVIKKIHECSLSLEATGKLTLTSKVGGATTRQVLTYSTCPL